MTDTTRAIVLAVSLALALTSIAAPATAQAGADANATTTETGPTDVTEQLGDLVIHDYSYSDGEMHIEMTWTGRMPTTLTLTEMIEMDDGGAAEISFKQVRLAPDERTNIRIAAEERSSGTAGVLLTTPESVENNNAVILQAGDAQERGPVPFKTASIFVGLAALGGAGLAFAFTYREHEDESDVERRERIA